MQRFLSQARAVLYVAALALASGAAWGQKTEIKIGFVNPTTGVFGTLGKYARKGVDLALDNAKQNPAFKDVTFTLIERDTATKVADAVRYARELIDRENIDVLMGGLSSAECLALQKVALEAKIVYINTNGCSADDFNEGNRNKYSFRINWNTRQGNQVFANWLVKNVGKRWYIAYSDFAYGQSGLKAFQQAINTAGGTVTGSLPVPFGATDMASYFSRVDTNADGIFFVFAGRDAILALQEALSRGLQKKMRFAGLQPTVIVENFPKIPDSAEGFTYVGEYPREPNGPLDNPWNHAYRKAYFAKNPGDVIGVNGFESYRAVNMLLIAVEKSGFRGRKDADKLAATLSGLEVPGSVMFPTGGMVIRKEDNQGAGPLYIGQFRGGKDVVIDTIPMSEVAKIK